ncbi:glycosyltransferase [Candidatus Nanopelagicales bacterium]|nr:glycosyltransferase [Candidatus Nanopelagicales bacterium]
MKGEAVGLAGKDVCVLEIEHSGHRLFFAVLLANHLADQGAKTTLATSPEAISSPEGREHLRFLDKRVEIVDCPKSKGLNYWIDFFSQTADKVVVLDGEGLVYQVTLPAADPKKIVALMLHSPELYKIRPTLNRLAKRALIQRARAKSYTLVNLASPGIVAEGRPGIAPDPSPFALIHNLAIPAGPVRLSQDRTWIGVFGGISARKGPELALDAIAYSRRKDLGLVVIGKWQNPDQLDRFTKKAKLNHVEVLLVNDYVSTEDLRSYIAGVDVVLVLNHNEGSSGILLGACALGKPVALGGSLSLKKDAKLLGVPWVNAQYGLLSQTLNHVGHPAKLRPSYKPNPDGSDFSGVIISALRGNLGVI